MKKALAITFVLIMMLSMFCACKTETPPAATDATAATDAPAATDVPAPVDNTVYTLTYAATSPQGSARDEQVETVLKDKLLEKSNGRIVLEVYYSGTLAGNKDMLEALTSGIADMGVFLTPIYQGQFPYSDLFSIPGRYYGNVAETDEVLRAYTEAYPDDLFTTDLIVGVRYSIGTQCIISVDSVNTAEDIKGRTLRAAASGLPLYETLGAAGVSMAAADVYEGLKLGTINATVTGMEGIKRNKLAEVADYIIPVPCHIGEEMISMSRSAYEELPADLQAVIDEVFAEMGDVLSVYTQGQEDECLAACYDMNPDLVVSEFSPEDLAAIEAIGTQISETRAAELDAKGLDGTGALQFLNDHAK